MSNIFVFSCCFLSFVSFMIRRMFLIHKSCLADQYNYSSTDKQTISSMESGNILQKLLLEFKVGFDI